MREASLKGFAVLLSLLAIPETGIADDEITALRKQAQSLYFSGDYQGALDSYRQLYEQENTYVYLYNIGTCEVQLKRRGLALDAWEAYLKEADAQDELREEDRRNVQIARKNVKKLKKKIGYLNISGEVNDAVFINGVYRAALPLAHELRVGEGVVSIEIKRGTQTLYQETVHVKSGESTIIESPDTIVQKSSDANFDNTAVPGSASLPPSSVVPYAPSNNLRPAKRIPMWISFGIGGAAGLIAVILGSVSLSKKNSFVDDCRDGDCTADREDERTVVNNLSRATDILLVASAISVATVILLFWRDRRQKRETIQNSGPHAHFFKDGYILTGSF